MSSAITRQIVLDTETTGMNSLGIHYEGHKIIEIGAIEVINRYLTGRHYHVYIKPDRLVDPEAFFVHGISDEFLQDKPTYADIAKEFLEFICGAELIIHNATFDIGFIDYEFRILNLGIPKMETFCKVTDTLIMARKLFPGKKNSLDSLCNRYQIDKSKRTLHGALLDAEILADVYLAMTGGQISLVFGMESENQQVSIKNESFHRMKCQPSSLPIVYASEEELTIHEARLDLIAKKLGSCLWRQ
ncbi:MAG: DNA polymerase III subunit epsilon [Candidatus Malihini olakiniferum]